MDDEEVGARYVELNTWIRDTSYPEDARLEMISHLSTELVDGLIEDREQLKEKVEELKRKLYAAQRRYRRAPGRYTR